MTQDKLTFLRQVESQAKDPEMLQAIIMYAINGIRKNAEEVRKHAVDMEIIANMAMNTRLFKGNEHFIANKLEGWKHMNGLNWEKQIKKLKEKT